jgi:hypothetical protein
MADIELKSLRAPKIKSPEIVCVRKQELELIVMKYYKTRSENVLSRWSIPPEIRVMENIIERYSSKSALFMTDLSLHDKEILIDIVCMNIENRRTEKRPQDVAIDNLVNLLNLREHECSLYIHFDDYI